jgi:hypothetical protein
LVGDVTGSFQPGDVFVLGRNLPHRFKNWSDGIARSRVIQFSDEVFGPVLSERNGFIGIRKLLAVAARGLLIRGPTAVKASTKIDRVFRHRERPVALGDLLGLLEFLSKQSELTQLCAAGYAPDLDSSGRMIGDFHPTSRSRTNRIDNPRKTGFEMLPPLSPNREAGEKIRESERRLPISRSCPVSRRLHAL